MVRVNEVRAGEGLGPVPGGEAYVSEWQAKAAPEIAAVATAEEGAATSPVPSTPAKEPKP